MRADEWNVSSLIILVPSPHLLLVFAQLSPHLSGLLGYLCDGDSWVLRLDPLAARVEPQHVGTHGPLGAASVLLLLLLLWWKKRKEINGKSKYVQWYKFIYTVQLLSIPGASFQEENVSDWIFLTAWYFSHVFFLLTYLFPWFPFFFLLNWFGFLCLLLLCTVIFAIVPIFTTVACRGIAVVPDWQTRRKQNGKPGVTSAGWDKVGRQKEKLTKSHSLLCNVVIFFSRIKWLIWRWKQDKTASNQTHWSAEVNMYFLLLSY